MISRTRRHIALSTLAGAAAHALPAGVAVAAAATSPPSPSTPRVLRYAFRVAETSFDPAAINDLYSRIITAHIFEGLYTFDPLARPAKVKPLVADGMPEVEDDFKRWTIKLKPGIFFADDEAFGGKPREVVAEDFVYAFKRYADPALKSPNWGFLNQFGLAGLEAQRQAAIDGKKPFDYDKPVAGVHALDRHTLRFELLAPRPRFVEQLLAGTDLWGAFAREVAEHYGENIGAHPVGSGPFRLAEWRRASRIVLARNPAYRERYYDAEPADDDAEGQAWVRRFKGRRLPMLDRVEVAIIEQNQPRWLSFLQGESNLIDRVPEEFIELATPGGKLAPNLAKQRLRAYRVIAPDATFTMFNMEDPVVGGYAPHQVALRRAIGLGVDLEREIALARHGQMIRAQSIIVPHTRGFDPAFKSEMSDYDPGRARALLDLYGYVDRDGDGWRELPDGTPLVLEMGNQDDQQSHQLGELWQRNMAAIGLKVRFRIQKWPENLKAARAGKLQMWDVSSLSSSSDGQTALERLYGPSSGGGNMARFKLKAFDERYDRMQVLPDGPERDALFVEVKRLSVAWMPYKIHGHRIVTDLAEPGVIGYRRPLFWQDFWHCIDVDPAVKRG